MPIRRRGRPRKIQTPQPRLVRVIRDVRNGDRDYWMPFDEARNLFHDGTLVMVNCYSGRWDFAHRDATR